MIYLRSIGKSKDISLENIENTYIKKINFHRDISKVYYKSVTGIKNNAFIKKKESEVLEKNLETLQHPIILLDEGGLEVNSIQFSKNLFTLLEQSKDISFVIGGAFGFEKKLADKYTKWSLSSLTFTHEMGRIILLEQIYRAICIHKNIKYHND